MKKLLTGFVCALLAIQAAAYQVTLPIQHRSKGSLQAGIRQGAEELILRLTAQRSALQVLSTELNHAQRWVDQYSTTHRPNDPDYPWLLDVTYSKGRVQQLLDEHHLPYWKQTPRPVSVLLKTPANEAITENDPRWLALRDAAALRGYMLNHLEQMPNALTNNGQAVELIVATLPNDPASEPTEQNQPEKTTTLTDGNTEDNNYHVESNGIQWSWYHQGEWQQWQQELSKQWAEQAAETIAAQLIQAQPAATTNNLTPVHLVIDGVRDFGAYVQVIRTLKQLHHVQSMIDDGVKNDQLSLTIIADVPIFDIKHSLDDVQQLTPQPDNTPGGLQADLRYYWGVPPQPIKAPAITSPTEAVLQPQSAVDEQAFPYDNAARDDAQRPKEDLTLQD